MKPLLEQLLTDAVGQLKEQGVVPADVQPAIAVTRTRDASHGDFASNLAMVLSKPAGMKPRDLSEKIVAALPASDRLDKVEIAGPGFINFYMVSDELSAVVGSILSAGEQFGRSDAGKGQKIQIEFISANPTGPLHVGHGRGAAMGASISNLLAAAGYDVQREYYVNDAGRQMDILATSIWLRYLGQHNVTFDFPVNGYKGEYIHDIARGLTELVGDEAVRSAATLFDGVSPDEPAGGNKEAHIDDLIQRARQLLGETGYRQVFDLGLNTILDDIRQDMSEFDVHFDVWFSERSLTEDVQAVIAQLKTSGHLYEKEGAWWFASTEFGDEKDRVVVRENGQSTYFASDLAYLRNKMERGFEKVLYVFGADHHGYVGRMLAACDALGYDRDRIEFLLIQFANLFSAGERQQMSTRSGEFITIRQLRDEVGKDAARYFYVMRRYQQHLEFDLDLARSQSKDNPVYYVQYAHARICSVERQVRDRSLTIDTEAGLQNLGRLTEPHESAVMTLLSTYPDIVLRAANAREPHQITTYLQELANALNKYYEAHKWLVDDAELRNARLCLILASRQVIKNGLQLINVSAPEVL